MGQIRLHIAAPKAEAKRIYEQAEAAFEAEGYPVAITDIDEKQAVSEVSVYVDESERRQTAQRLILCANMDAQRLKIEVLPDIDWVQHSLEGLKPVRAGRFLVHGGHDRGKRKPHEIGIEIEAGQAFGTGHHGTTAGCLEMISVLMRRERPRNILDLGAGSGVLAIAMAKLQPARVLATDIDPVATQVAHENIRRNGSARSVQATTAAGFQHPQITKRKPFDLIVANILACPLMRMAPSMARMLTRGGSLILSGILDSQRNKVLAAYRIQGLYHCRTLHREGWVTLHLK